MAWSGFREAAAGESGLELSLGLPAYFTKPAPPPAGAGTSALDGLESTGAGASARQPEGGSYKAKPAVAAAPVVGWPPVRSFRRNLAASKPSSSKEDGRASKDNDVAVRGADEPSGRKGLFVKVNMDGVPIGRKVELKQHGSYAELSATVDNLFRSLLAAQRDTAAAPDAIAGGEYTLVYEDDEGDRMLVGDVPWHMFIVTAKRLRGLKSSDLPASSLTAAGSRKRPAAAADR
ncbi:Auxin-responsive protein IAA16 [Hordeum vulgare]|uniref:Auxin-responsive protein n=1 Tax=Hordeum vulgare subsp. vulgare TaxID=112509 RepID=M0X3Y1_HORVV|nr:auxin-responsive protein IAA2-like [Hordeum vulgare subsp. vulgare]KAE8807052.1 Auxin-responsive protein IAA16 [Hordeum vulgare]